MTEEKIRLSKRLSELGLCSRREADQYIQNGWVFVDGKRISELGSKVTRSQKVSLSKEAQSNQKEKATILLHKPVGYVSGQAEKGYKAAVTLIKKDRQFGEEPWTFKILEGLAPAGRLDIDSKGLLVLTQDGSIAKQLIGENSKIEKEYLVRVDGDVEESQLKKLRFGLSLNGKKLKRAKVDLLEPQLLRMILVEGKKRQIRRMCELVDLKVTSLKRVRIGQVKLGKLPLGQWRYLKDNESF